jgi:alpha-glucosidase
MPATAVKDAPDPASDPNWWKGGVVYQVYPRSFQDSNGDGIGDLPGVTRRLPYIAALGVDAIWLSPFFTSPMDDMGYDVADYCDVDPMFGTLADFDAMLAQAHRLGLKVIIDQVLSHCSDQHEWFRESRASRDNRRADWFVWADAQPDGTPPNNWPSVFGGSAWEWDGTRQQYYLHNFLASQPDLNFHNREVQDALLDTVRFWLERGVDGFRLDTVNFYFHDAELRSNPPVARANDGPGEVNPYGMQDHIYSKSRPENIGFLRRFRALLDEYDGRASVGEVGDGERALQIVGDYTAGDGLLHMCYTFDLLGPDFSAEHFRNAVQRFEGAVADGWVCWAFSNHDVNRHLSRWLRAGDDPAHLARFSVALLACLRGSLCIYQGEELALQEAEIAFEDLTDPYGIRFWPAYKGRDGCRTPMVWEAGAANGGFSSGKPWLPVPEAHRAAAVDSQGPGSVLESYREILAFRKAHAALQTGTITFLPASGNVLAFLREDAGETLLCVFNLDRAPVQWVLPDGMQVGDNLMPGFAGEIHDTTTLNGLDAVCARLT